MKHTKSILPVIILSQFCCTALWFAGNGVINDLVVNFGLQESVLGHLTSAVQFGFIIGTLIFAVLAIADRFSPSKVFLFSAVFASLFNLGIIWQGNGLVSLLTLRFFTGFFLAGIYPVGMKIASDYYKVGLGKSLGFLVGALVLGTAFPHLLKDMFGALPWKTVLITTSILSVFGGFLLVVLVPDGPYRKSSKQNHLSACFSVFKIGEFRSVAFGYFGHMWELYAFWVFVPVMLKTYSLARPETVFNIPLLSFIIIGVGSLACVISGYLTQIVGEKKIAFIALLLSGVCCLLLPFMFAVEHESFFIGFLIFWGMVVIADSPLFSTLVAQNAPDNIKGSALTIVNCIGFSITIISIQCMTWLIELTNSNNIYSILAIGPLLGLMALGKKLPIFKKASV